MVDDHRPDEQRWACAHRLRGHVGAIVGFAELMADGAAGPLNDQQAEFIDKILHGAHDAMRLLDDVTLAIRFDS